MSISKAEHDELCCVYAGLLLFDDGSEITADKINKIEPKSKIKKTETESCKVFTCSTKGFGSYLYSILGIFGI